MRHTIRWDPGFSSCIACPICAKFELRDAFLAVDDHRWFGCTTCSNAFVFPFSYPDYAEDYGFSKYNAYYCETGAGLECMMAPLEALRSLGGGRSYLDVGCGYGFTVHYARTMLGWEAIGVDPASYARQGAKDLAIEIDALPLGAGSRADGLKFDVVMASEVIEHVREPQAFVGLLREHVTEDGVCILTTPNVDTLGANSSFSTIVASSFPGFHCLCFSAQGLQDVLAKAGFAAIRIEKIANRLIVFASPSPNGLDHLKTDAAMRPEYFDVLAETVLPGAVHIQIGLAYRKFRDAVSQADHARAAACFDQLEQACRAAYRLNYLDPTMLRARGREGGFEAFGATLPYMAAAMAFFAGILAQQLGKHKEAERWFHLMLELAETLARCRTSTCWWTEAFDLYREAQLALAVTLLSLGEVARPIEYLEDLVDPAVGEKGMDSKLVPIGAFVSARAIQQLGVAKMRAGRRDEAAAHLQSSVDVADNAGFPDIAAQSRQLIEVFALDLTC